MLEYTLDDAQELLSKNLASAEKNLAEIGNLFILLAFSEYFMEEIRQLYL